MAPVLPNLEDTPVEGIDATVGGLPRRGGVGVESMLK